MNILALDLGTKTGYAWKGYSELFFEAGTWTLATAKEIAEFGKSRMSRRCDPRVCRLSQKLYDICDSIAKPNLIVFEDVQFATTTMQVQLWSSFRTAVWLIGCRYPEILIECVPVATLKKFATGNGHADKLAMARFLKIRYPQYFRISMDDNAIDACWLYLWAQVNLGRATL